MYKLWLLYILELNVEIFLDTLCILDLNSEFNKVLNKKKCQGDDWLENLILMHIKAFILNPTFNFFMTIANCCWHLVLYVIMVALIFRTWKWCFPTFSPSKKDFISFIVLTLSFNILISCSIPSTKMMSDLLEKLLYFFVKEDLYKSPLLSCKKVV